MSDEETNRGIDMAPTRHRSVMLKVNKEFLADLRNLTFFVQYKGIKDVPDTVIGNLEEAMRRYLEAMRRKYNDGKPFPKARGELRQGRPPAEEKG